MSDARTQHCECGSEEYHVKFTLDAKSQAWAECVECGRPSKTLGCGWKKQAEWVMENHE